MITPPFRLRHTLAGAGWIVALFIVVILVVLALAIFRGTAKISVAPPTVTVTPTAETEETHGARLEPVPAPEAPPTVLLSPVTPPAVQTPPEKTSLAELDFPGENIQIGAIWAAAALAPGSAEASDAETKIAGLMAESWRGKRLSRWCFYALNKIGKTPAAYRSPYMKSAGWLYNSAMIRAKPGARARSCGAMGTLCYRYDFYGARNIKTLHPDPERAERLLRVAKKDEDATVRACAVSAMESMGAKPTTAELIESFRKADNGAKSGLLGAMGETGAAEVFPFLLASLHDEDVLMRSRAGSAMLRYANHIHKQPEVWRKAAETAVPALIARLKDEKSVMYGCISALREFGPHAKSAIDELQRILRDAKDDFTQGIVINALGELGPDAEKTVPDMLLIVDKSCQSQIACALGKLGNGRTGIEPVLLRLVKSTDRLVRAEAAYSLGQIGAISGESLKTLEQLGANDADALVRSYAQRGLQLLAKTPVKPPEAPKGDF